jgi:general secretion pathway protein M
MKSYLNTLNERERWMVYGTVLCVFVYVYYLLIYAPLASKVEERGTLLIEKTQTLEWMNKVKQHKKSAVVKKSVDNGQLLTLLATKLKNNATLKFPYQLQQTNSGDVQLSFEQIPFNLFIKWLNSINSQYVINMKQFDVNKTKTPGLTRLMIIVSSSN